MPFKKYPGAGTGTGTTFIYLPGTSVSSVRLPYPYPNFCEFCKTSIPVPGTSVSSVRLPYPYPELLWVLYDCGTIPGVRVYLCHNTRGTGTDSGIYRARYVLQSDVMSRQPDTQNTKIWKHTQTTKHTLSLTTILVVLLYCRLVFACFYLTVLLVGLNKMWRACARMSTAAVFLFFSQVSQVTFAFVLVPTIILE